LIFRRGCGGFSERAAAVMSTLLLSLAAFTAFHVLPSTPLRGMLIASLGRPAFMALFSLVSVALTVWVYVAFRHAPVETAYWATGQGMRMASAVVMLFAFLLLTFAATERRPVILTGENVLKTPEAIRGALRITRHPTLWAIGLWALVHMVNNANAPAWTFFGYCAVLALGGTALIDRRRKRLLPPDAGERLRAETSNTPFAATLAGRNRLALGEFALWKAGLATALWAAVMHAHPLLFGVHIF
jgi:uncharacterized membrane protein